MISKHILVVDDERDIRELIKEILEDEGYEVVSAESAEEARNALRTRRPDLVLLDVWLPDMDGVRLLREWHEQGGLDCPVIMISGHGTIETAVEATRLGAYDFLEKPLSLSKLLLVVQRALEAAQLLRENIGLRRRIQPLSEPIGASKAMVRLRGQLQQIAKHNAWVLMLGEQGSGKGLFAQYLHRSSPRSNGPFVEVRVASIAGRDAAAELFGLEEEGSVSYGLLDKSSGGTLFLSDVGDMDLGVQAKLLGALANKSFVRVGGREAVGFDVRVVAATRKNLAEEVRAGRFREDLYYQLNVVPVVVPPLREHAEDVPELLQYYVDFFSSQEGLPYRTFSDEAVKRLMGYTWEGNVRELKNLVQRLLILCHGDQILLDDVNHALGLASRSEAAEISVHCDASLRSARTEFERAYFRYQLEVLGGNMGKVALRAGIERTHLYRKLRSLGLKVKQDQDSG